MKKLLTSLLVALPILAMANSNKDVSLILWNQSDYAFTDKEIEITTLSGKSLKDTSCIKDVILAQPSTNDYDTLVFKYNITFKDSSQCNSWRLSIHTPYRNIYLGYDGNYSLSGNGDQPYTSLTNPKVSGIEGIPDDAVVIKFTSSTNQGNSSNTDQGDDTR